MLPRVIRPFDNSYFSEFGTFGITDRAGDTPAELHGTILGCRRRPSRHRRTRPSTSSKARRRGDRRSRSCSPSTIGSRIDFLTAWIADNPPALLTLGNASPASRHCPLLLRKAGKRDFGRAETLRGIAQPPKGVALAHESQRCGSSRRAGSCPSKGI